MSNEFYRPVNANVLAVTGVEPERAIRLYCTHAFNGGTWELQVRAPQRLANGNLGKTFFVATATIERDDLVALQDAINTELQQVC